MVQNVRFYNMKTIFSISISVLMSSHVFAQKHEHPLFPTPADEKTFDRPIRALIVDLRKSENSSGEVREECFEYPEFAIYQVDDRAIKGAARFEIRSRSKLKMADKDLCAKGFKGQEVGVPEAYFKGVKGDFIVLDGADGFGEEIDFHIYSAKKQKKIFSAKRELNSEWSFEIDKGTLRVELSLSLDVRCSVFEKGDICRNQIAKLNKLPKRLIKSIPDCKELYVAKKNNEPPEYESHKIPSQLFIKAKIQFKKVQQIFYIGDEFKCGEQSYFSF